MHPSFLLYIATMNSSPSASTHVTSPGTPVSRHEKRAAQEVVRTWEDRERQMEEAAKNEWKSLGLSRYSTPPHPEAVTPPRSKSASAQRQKRSPTGPPLTPTQQNKQPPASPASSIDGWNSDFNTDNEASPLPSQKHLNPNASAVRNAKRSKILRDVAV